MLEQYQQKRIIDNLKNSGAYVVKVVTASISGVPDIIACYKGRFIGIEVKAKGKKPSELQNYNLNKIKESGGYSLVAYSFSDVVPLLHKIDKEIPGDRNDNT